LTKALKDKNTCKAFVKAYNTVKKMTEWGLLFFELSQAYFSSYPHFA
jgi:hypothetical protein